MSKSYITTSFSFYSFGLFYNANRDVFFLSLELSPSIRCFGFIDYLIDFLTTFESKNTELYFFNGLFDDLKVAREEFKFDKFEESKF